MPWYGDQFEYTHAYIQAIIENYLPLKEAALNDPYSNPAVLIYDIDIALEGAGLTRRQAEAMLLRMEGLTEMEIGAVLKRDHSSVCRRLRGGFYRITDFFNGELHKNPAARANN